MLNKSIKFFIENKLIAFLILTLFIVWGIATAPFNWDTGMIPRNPVAVDAIPDIGENQQIVFTKWQGRSPQDIEDQISYPLTSALLGIPGVKTIRSSSMFGFSSIYIIFEEDIEFYWSRSRNQLWHKGATSGQIQKVAEMRTDCDKDVVLMRVLPQREGACHVGYNSCFYRSIQQSGSGEIRLIFEETKKVSK